MSRLYVRLGFSDDSTDIFNRSVRAATGGPGHAIIEIFDGAETTLWESVWKVDPKTHKSGVRSAPMSKITEWIAQEPEHRIYVTVPETGYLPLTKEEADTTLRMLKDAQHTIHYAKLQLGQNLLAKFGARIAFGDGSPLSWTCSETAVRVEAIPPRFWDHFGHMDIHADEIVPGGVSRYSLMAAANRIVAEHGAVAPGEQVPVSGR